MALTYSVETGTGASQVYDLRWESTLGYLTQSDVYVYYGDDYTQQQIPFTWVNATQIQLTANAASTFRIRRVVDRSKAVNDYVDGAILRDKNLDDSYAQALMILEEITDGWLVPRGDISLDGDLNLLQHIIYNVTRVTGLNDATGATDAVPLAQLQRLLVDNNFQSVVPIVQPRQTIIDGQSQYDAPHTKLSTPESFFVSYDGITQRPGTDFTVGAIGKIDLLGSLPIGADLDITYFEPRVTGTKIATYNTVADMVAGAPVVGTVVHTLGYYAVADGGGAQYVVTNGQTGDGWGDHTIGGNTATLDTTVTVNALMYGIPLVSSGTDYAVPLQTLISQPNFEFPKGFECDSTTLLPQSNTVGNFRNAKIRLPNNSIEGTMVVLVGNPLDGSQVENTTYYGGVIDGNRSNGNEHSGATGPWNGIGGGDGGQHGIQIYSTRAFRWYSPTTINCGTDGIMVWERSDRYLPGIPQSVVTDTHIHNPRSDGNRRQGYSIINCTDIDIYSPVGENTGGATGLPPSAGMDIEGNNPGDHPNVRLHGEALFRNNDGRGFVLQSDGGTQVVTADTIRCYGNGAGITIDGQVVMYCSKENAKNTLIAKRIHTSDGEGIWTGKGTDAGTKENVVDVDTILCGGATGRVRFTGRDTVDVNKLTSRFDSASVGSVALGIAPDVLRVNIGTAQVGNDTETVNSYTFQVDAGDARVIIDNMRSSGARAGRVLQNNVVIKRLDLFGRGLGDMVRVSGAAGCEIAITSNLESLAGSLCTLENSASGNKIETYHEGLENLSIIVVSGARNKVSCHSRRISGNTAISVGPGASNTHILNSYFEGASTNFVTDNGTNTLITGSYPASVNS